MFSFHLYSFAPPFGTSAFLFRAEVQFFLFFPLFIDLYIIPRLIVASSRYSIYVYSFSLPC